MNIVERYKLALLQLKEYSDNNLIIVGKEVLDIDLELKSLEPCHCPKCKSEKISTYDNSALDTSGENDFLDDEIYAMAVCHDCNHRFNVIGDIAWKQPKL